MSTSSQLSSRVEQRTTEHIRCAALCRFAVQKGDERLASEVVTGMGARAGDATAEGQPAIFVIEERLPRRHGAKVARFPAVVVAYHGRAWESGGRAPQVGRFPAAA